MNSANHKGGSKGDSGGGGSGKDVVDRQKQCPFLLRVFVSNSRHNMLKDFNRGSTPDNELQIYTWMDASLKELTALVREVNADSRRKGTYFDVGRVYSVHNPKTTSNNEVARNRIDNCDYGLKKIGTCVAGRRGVDDHKTLRDIGFNIGDYLDIAVSPPSSGGVGPIRGGFGGFRGDRLGGERDFGGDGGRQRGGGGFGGFGGPRNRMDRNDRGGGFGGRGRRPY